MKLSATKSLAAAAVAISLVSSAMFLASCDSGGGGDGPSGTSTILGNVSSYEAAAGYYVPTRAEKGFARFVQDVLDLIVTPAQAAVGGVVVRVTGTDLEGTTAEDGSFVISGVPSGDKQLEFVFAGSTASLAVNVPDNSTITLTDVRVSGGNVRVGSSRTVTAPSDNGNANANGNDNSGGNSNGNDNGDDHGNANSNANDNDDDDNGNANSNANDNDDDDNGNANSNSNSNANDNEDDDNDNGDDHGGNSGKG